jgi:hypothetical protein
MNNKMKFVVSHLDRQSGPFDEQELRAQWAKGELLPIDYVYDEVKQDWILLSERFPWAGSEHTAETAEAQLPLPPPLRVPKESSAEKAKAIILKDGSGELEIDVLKPGELELVIDSRSPLKMEAPFKVTVKPAHPRELVWEVKEPQAVGQDCEVLVRAVNEMGQPCLGHDETYILHIRGPLVQDVDLPMKDGQAFVKFNHTRAETWSLSLHSPHSHPLSLPEIRQVEWRPGPAVRLILDGPREYVAGKPMKVQVRALDAYGNLATTFQGTINLEVKAS